MAEAKDMGGAVVGATVPFIDAPEKATGSALYLDDLRLPGMLVGRALRSEYAHAEILSVEANSARGVPGVVAVLTADDLKPLNLHWIPTLAGDTMAARSPAAATRPAWAPLW